MAALGDAGEADEAAIGDGGPQPAAAVADDEAEGQEIEARRAVAADEGAVGRALISGDTGGREDMAAAELPDVRGPCPA